jgi:hypothetical protein
MTTLDLILFIHGQVMFGLMIYWQRRALARRTP